MVNTDQSQGVQRVFFDSRNSYQLEKSSLTIPSLLSDRKWEHFLSDGLQTQSCLDVKSRWLSICGLSHCLTEFFAIHAVIFL